MAKKISLQTLKKSWLTWFFWHGSSQQAETMLGNSFAHSLNPVAKELYPNPEDKEERIEMYKRSLTLFNTEQQVGAICPGIIIGMEEARANDKQITPEVIQAVKVALIGPTSAIGDSIYVATLIPILLTFAMTITHAVGEGAGWIGPAFYMIVYPIGTAIMSWQLWKLGYKTGADGIKRFMQSGTLDQITKSVVILGLIVVGALTASFVSVSIPITITPTGGEEAVANVDQLINNIFPNILPLALTMGIYRLYAKKKWKPLSIMGLILVLAIILTAVGYLFGAY